MPKTVIPAELPVVSIGKQQYLLVPVSALKPIIAVRNCKFMPRGESYADWVDAMDRYYGCLLQRVP